MKTYLVSFLNVSDKTSLSANIPDYTVHSVLLFSPEPISEEMLRKYEKIGEIYKEYECDGISYEEITREEIDEYDDCERIYL